MDPDGVDDILKHMNKSQGCTVTTNNETKTSADWSKGKSSDNSNANIVLTESIYEIGTDGEISDISVTETAVSATIDDGEVTGTKSEQLSKNSMNPDNARK